MPVGQCLKISLLATASLWVVFGLNLLLPVDLLNYGIVPRRLSGLIGIIASPFLHLGLWHLVANTSAFFVLLALTLSLGGRQAAVALTVIVLAGGLGVWLVGGRAIHVGASGVIYGLIGFLVLYGFLARQWKALAASILVLFLYSGALYGLLAPRPGVSMSGHICGFLAGLLAAKLIAPKDEPETTA